MTSQMKSKSAIKFNLSTFTDNFSVGQVVWALAPLEFPLHDLCRTGHRPSFLLGFALLEF